MSRVTTIPHGEWTAEPSPAVVSGAISALETGDVLSLPALRFEVRKRERRAFSPGIVGAQKNVAFNPRTGKVSGTVLEGDDLAALSEMLARFCGQASALVDRLLPAYRGRLETGRSSFRPVEIAGRASSWRKDDTRLHIDSFPASPVQGRRILRVFANVNLEGRPRSWRIGEEFETVARRFAAALRSPLPGSSDVLQWLRLTKSRRTAYDAMMLQLHDRMKADAAYQAECAQMSVEFASGTAWVAFTDQVSHAAMSGQYQLEQTFLLSIDAMLDERRSPLRVLEQIKGRPLV
jgi:hypothetical protein